MLKNFTLESVSPARKRIVIYTSEIVSPTKQHSVRCKVIEVFLNIAATQNGSRQDSAMRQERHPPDVKSVSLLRIVIVLNDSRGQ
jgi:hypothetical protein